MTSYSAISPSFGLGNFRRSPWFFNITLVQVSVMEVREWTYGLTSLSEKTRMSNRCPSGFGPPCGYGSPRTKSASAFGPPQPISASGFGLPGGPKLLADMVSPRGFGRLVIILFEERKYIILQCFFILPHASTSVNIHFDEWFKL